MCGIVGIVSAQGPLADGAALVEAMISKLVHRGPDASGVWAGDGAALGQRRLSIIDLSANGRQPMASTDGRTQLVCNGEIYNFQDLRRDEAAGYRYASNTDVEVILPLYERLGADAVLPLVGMFAIGLWDGRHRRLLLARDRVGEKPLYYAEANGTLAFASEIKALLTLPWIDRSIDEEAVAHLLAYQALPAPFTIYKGIRQLAPAERLVWEKGCSRRDVYWSVDFARRGPGWTAGLAREAYGALMRQSVKGQLIADVPIGVMLSGGIDSTTIARLAREQDPGVRTFCIGGDGSGRPDEEHARAEKAARILKTRHANVLFGALGLGDLLRVLAHYDQPCSSFVALYADALAREMRREVKVVLSGNGADEVFAGYAAYPRLAPLDVARRVAAPIAPAAAALYPSRGSSALGRFIELARHDVAAGRGRQLSAAAHALMPRLTTDAFAARWRSADPGRIVETVIRRSNAATMLQAATIADLMVCHQHGHSLIADMSGMAHGLELRSPFLDHRLIEFAATLPPALLVGRLGRTADAKLIAKEHLAEVMPASLINARKIGFGYGIPIDDLVRRQWRPSIERLLTRGRYLELGIFSEDGVRYALASSYYATAILVSFAVFAEVHLFGRDVRVLEAELTPAIAA